MLGRNGAQKSVISDAVGGAMHQSRQVARVAFQRVGLTVQGACGLGALGRVLGVAARGVVDLTSGGFDVFEGLRLADGVAVDGGDVAHDLRGVAGDVGKGLVGAGDKLDPGADVAAGVFDELAGIGRGVGRAFGEFAHLFGDDGEAGAGLAGAGGFDGG